MSEDARLRRDTASSWVARGLLAVAIVFLLENAKPLMLPVVIAIAFTFVLAAPVRWLRRHGVPEFAGAGLVIATVLAIVVAAGVPARRAGRPVVGARAGDRAPTARIGAEAAQRRPRRAAAGPRQDAREQRVRRPRAAAPTPARRRRGAARAGSRRRPGRGERRRRGSVRRDARHRRAQHHPRRARPDAVVHGLGVGDRLSALSSSWRRSAG